MRIALISTLAGPVHPDKGGSIEQLIWLLSRELTRLGHEVTVFAAAGSEPHGELVETLPGPYAAEGAPDDWHVCEWINLCAAVRQSGRFDVLHSHTYLWSVPLGPLSRAPIVHTTHIMPGQSEAFMWSCEPEACVTALSEYQWQAFSEHRPAAVVHHGLDPGQFTFQPLADHYVCFLGRFLPDKGPLAAIAAARASGVPILLAGNANDYYRHHIEPLVDGRDVRYVGWVCGPERNRLLAGAKALLYPISVPEPFGLVMIEAMMCGTPVAAVRIGAVGEVVEDGVTGYCADGAHDLDLCLRRCFALDRLAVRRRAEERFSADRMARQYLQVYESVLRRTLGIPSWEQI